MHSTLTHSTGTSQGLPHIRFYVGLCWGPDLTLIGFHFKGGSPFGVCGGGTHGQRVFQPRVVRVGTGEKEVLWELIRDGQGLPTTGDAKF